MLLHIKYCPMLRGKALGILSSPSTVTAEVGRRETHSNATEIRPKALAGAPFAKRKWQRPSEL